MIENELSGEIIGAAIEVHRVLGPGLLESIYEEAFQAELENRNIRVTLGLLINFNSTLLSKSVRRIVNRL